MADSLREQLLSAARSAAQAAHCPYSNFHVGAAALMDDQIFLGCNVENASYGLTICAERVAIFNGIASGKKRVQAIAVACVDAPAASPIEQRMPCGACRQVIAELGGATVPIYVDGAGDHTLGDLLPFAFFLST